MTTIPQSSSAQPVVIGSVEQLEQLVLTAYSAHNPQEQAKSTWILHDWIEKSSNSGGNIIPLLLQLTMSTSNENVFFYALTTLSRMNLNDNEQKQLRDYLLRQFLFQHNPSIPVINKVAFMLVQQIVKNVAAIKRTNATTSSVIMWSTVWDDIFQLVQQQPSASSTTPNNNIPNMTSTLLFLKTFYCLLDDIQSNNDQHHNRKDLKAAKEAFYDENLSTRLLEHLIQIFQQSSASLVVVHVQQQQQQQTQQQTQQQQQQLAVLSLSVIKLFLIEFYLSPKQYQPVLQTFLSSLQYGVPSSENNSVVAAAGSIILIPICSMAVECLHEFMIGPTPFPKKQPILIPLLQSLNQILQYSKYNNELFLEASNQNHEQDALPVQVAKLINVIGTQIFTFWQEQGDDSSSKAFSDHEIIWNALLELLMVCLSHEDMDVAASVLPFIDFWITYTADFSNDVAHSIHPTIPSILSNIYQQMKYDDDVGEDPDEDDDDFDDEDDEIRAQEEMIRSNLCKIYIKFVRIAPDVCLQFLVEFMKSLQQQQQQSTTQDGRKVAWQNMEAFLRFLFHYCEGVRPPPGLNIVMKNETFVSLLLFIQATTPSTARTSTTPPGATDAMTSLVKTYYNNRRVLILYYQTVVRYYPLLKVHVHLLHQILQALSGNCGLQHPDKMVRSRSCYFLSRLIQSIVVSDDDIVRGNASNLLTPHIIESAIMGIQGLLQQQHQQQQQQQQQQYYLRPDDMFYLFETIGLLVGKTNVPPVDQKRFLQIVMTPHVQSIQSILNNNTNSNAAIIVDYEDILSNSIAALAHVSKGYSNTEPPDETHVQPIFVETVQIALKVLQVLPTSEVIRSKTMIFLQRMIHCIQLKILDLLPSFLFLLIQHCTNEDVLFVAQLMNQACMKFQHHAIPALDASLLPFLRKCQYLSQQLVISAEGNSNPTNVSNSNTGILSDSGGRNIPLSSLPHIQTEQMAVEKLAYSVLEHIATNFATGILFSSTNGSSLEAMLQTMYHGAIDVQDATVKKICIKFFQALFEQTIGGRENNTKNNNQTNNNNTDNANVSSVQLLQQQVRQNPQQQEGLWHFMGNVYVSGMLFQCMLLPTFKERDAQQARNVRDFAKILFSIKLLQPSSEGEARYQKYVLNPLLHHETTRRLQQQQVDMILHGFRSAGTVPDLTKCLREWMKVVKNTST